MMRRALKWIAWILVFSSAIACGPAGFDKPLSDPEKATLDPSLLGLWYRKVDDNDGYILFAPSTKKNIMEMMWFISDAKGGIEIMFFEAFPTWVEDQKYLNLRPIKQMSTNEEDEKDTEKEENAKESGYIIAKYKIASNRLRLWYADDDAFKQAIEDKILSGRLNGDDNIIITDSPDNTLKFMHRYEEYGAHQVFTDFGEYKRLR